MVALGLLSAKNAPTESVNAFSSSRPWKLHTSSHCKTCHFHDEPTSRAIRISQSSKDIYESDEECSENSGSEVSQSRRLEACLTTVCVTCMQMNVNPWGKQHVTRDGWWEPHLINSHGLPKVSTQSWKNMGCQHRWHVSGWDEKSRFEHFLLEYIAYLLPKYHWNLTLLKWLEHRQSVTSRLTAMTVLFPSEECEPVQTWSQCHCRASTSTSNKCDIICLHISGPSWWCWPGEACEEV